MFGDLREGKKHPFHMPYRSAFARNVCFLYQGCNLRFSEDGHIHREILISW